jgi:hypothetical protein
LDPVAPVGQMVQQAQAALFLLEVREEVRLALV